MVRVKESNYNINFLKIVCERFLSLRGNNFVEYVGVNVLSVFLFF